MTDCRKNYAVQTERCSCPKCRAERERAAVSAGESREACAVPELLPVMVFIPVQRWDTVYDCDRALDRGTLFPALDKPFFGKGGCGCVR